MTRLRAPVQLFTLELSQPLVAALAPDRQWGRAYVRLHGQPLGTLDFTHGDDLAEQVAALFHADINAHLAADGLAKFTTLPVTPDCPRLALPASTPLVSVVVCTRNRPETLRRCLAALDGLDYPALDLIVVDNAPDDDTTAVLTAGYPRVRYVREDRPGLARARNAGLAAAQGVYVAFTDDDAAADAGWVRALVAGFCLSERAACVTGWVLPSELETDAQLLFEEFSGFNKGRTLTMQQFDRAEHQPPNDPLFPYAASKFGAGVNMAFRTDVLRQLGGFDVALGAGTLAQGAEDIDAFFRVIWHGWTLVVNPAALVWHQHRRTYAELRRQLYGYGVAFTAYVMKTILSRPAHLLTLVMRVPAALGYLFSPRSARNVNKSSGYPAELTRSELLGMAVGWLAYIRSRLRLRHQEAHPPA